MLMLYNKMVIFELRMHPSLCFIPQEGRPERHFLKKDRTTKSKKYRTSQEKPDNGSAQRQTQKDLWRGLMVVSSGWILNLGNFGLPRSFWKYLVQSE